MYSNQQHEAIRQSLHRLASDVVHQDAISASGTAATKRQRVILLELHKCGYSAQAMVLPSDLQRSEKGSETDCLQITSLVLPRIAGHADMAIAVMIQAVSGVREMTQLVR